MILTDDQYCFKMAVNYFKMVAELDVDAESYMFLSQYCNPKNELTYLRKAAEKGYPFSFLLIIYHIYMV